MPGAQLWSSASAPALPDEASLLCGDNGTWHNESLVTDKRDGCDPDKACGDFLSPPNLTLR